MSTEKTISFKVKLDYRSNHLEFEDLFKYLQFKLDANNVSMIYYKNKLLSDAIKIEFSDEEKKQISEGARVRFNLLNFEEKDEKKVDLDVNYFLDISNIEKSKIAKQELEKFKNEINSSVGIYRLELNGKTYVGQSTDLRRRLTQHIESLIYGTHTNRELQNAWEIENLEIKFEILEYENLNQKGIQLQDWLASRERFHISHDRTLLKNINVLDGEVVVTKSALNEYKKIRSDALSHVKEIRKTNKVINKQEIEDERSKRDALNLTLISVETKLTEIRNSKGFVLRFFSAIGVIKAKGKEKDLIIERNAIKKSHDMHAANLTKLRETERLLRKRRLTDDEMKTLKAMGYEYRSEYHDKL
jgi:hypothetical protein